MDTLSTTTPLLVWFVSFRSFGRFRLAEECWLIRECPSAPCAPLLAQGTSSPASPVSVSTARSGRTNWWEDRYVILSCFGGLRRSTCVGFRVDHEKKSWLSLACTGACVVFASKCWMFFWRAPLSGNREPANCLEYLSTLPHWCCIGWLFPSAGRRGVSLVT